MKRLTRNDKEKIIKLIKKSKWAGCFCDKCLCIIIDVVTQYLEKHE